MNRQQLLQKLDKAWVALGDAFAGLSEAQMTEPGVSGDWSVKDTLGHVTTWEQEALAHLPHIATGQRLPRYADLYGGIDAFNALRVGENGALSLAEVRARFEDVHRQLLAMIESAPEELLTKETRYRRRIRLDTYSHYPVHAEAIREWREERGY